VRASNVHRFIRSRKRRRFVVTTVSTVIDRRTSVLNSIRFCKEYSDFRSVSGILINWYQNWFFSIDSVSGISFSLPLSKSVIIMFETIKHLNHKSRLNLLIGLMISHSIFKNEISLQSMRDLWSSIDVFWSKHFLIFVGVESEAMTIMINKIQCKIGKNC